jgi:hypothetical protein
MWVIKCISNKENFMILSASFEPNGKPHRLHNPPSPPQLQPAGRGAASGLIHTPCPPIVHKCQAQGFSKISTMVLLVFGSLLAQVAWTANLYTMQKCCGEENWWYSVDKSYLILSSHPCFRLSSWLFRVFCSSSLYTFLTSGRSTTCSVRLTLLDVLSIRMSW